MIVERMMIVDYELKVTLHTHFQHCSFVDRYALTKAFCVAFVLTFFPMFDVPVFWPILLLYWIVLFALTMKRQIRHMIKYKYVPFSFGKQVIVPLMFNEGNDFYFL
jgi:hypothetical protein